MGSGLRTLATTLSHGREDTALVELLDLEEPDAPAAGLLQAIAAVPDADARQRLIEKLPATRDAALAVVKALAEAKKALVVLIPPAWGRAGEDPAEDDEHRARGRALLQGFATAPRLVLLSDFQVDLSALGVSSLPEVRLQAHLVPLEPESAAWGRYAAVARQLGEALPPGQLNSPLVWRLAVGTLALQAPLAEVQEWCRRPAAGALARLVALLAGRIRLTPGLVGPVRRALRIRRPLPPDVLVSVTGLPAEHAPLLTECLGYGNPVRISPSLRAQLVDALAGREAPLEEAHAALARHYQLLDGVASPGQVGTVPQMEAWVERAHHLACAGDEGTRDWDALELPSPEFYWDRARALSIRYKRYEQAAQVYLACLERFSDDDYSHHYAAWNLEKAQREPELSREHYAQAVMLAPDNPWWNARLVGFLIRSGQRAEARFAWQRALQSVDPDGTATARSAWLASHLHYWVAEAWLDVGHWREAQRVVQGIPAEIRERSYRPFKELLARSERAEREERARLSEWFAAQPGPSWDTAEALWEELVRRMPSLPLPAAGVGEDGCAQLAWSLPELYVEIEVGEGGQLAWYARDCLTQKSEAGEIAKFELTPALVRWLERVAHA
ncbi:MAG: tetratricopeptide repeat protein [Myxococcaceae bacterium]|nr:tetratricopeptide repeat protein [Myxococcaceae bacterium]